MMYLARIFATLLSAVVGQAAYASDGAISFSGALLDSTCVVSVNGDVGPAAASVTLPKVSAAKLDTANATAGQTTFRITLSACVGARKTAFAYFESGNGVDPYTGHLNNTGTATQVQLQLIDPINRSVVIKAGNVGQLNKLFLAVINAAGKADLPYAIQYISTGKATAGSVRGNVTYSIIYP